MIFFIGGTLGIILVIIHLIFHSGDRKRQREADARELVVMQKHLNPERFSFLNDLAMAEDPKLRKQFRQELKKQGLSNNQYGRSDRVGRSIPASMGIFFLKYMVWALIGGIITVICGVSDQTKMYPDIDYVIPMILIILFSIIWWFPKRTMTAIRKLRHQKKAEQ